MIYVIPQDVAGTSIYDEKRAQSLKLLEDTHNVRNRIEESLKHIEERLAELDVCGEDT
jgi:structural maintenance of chromosome 3 (chondroitin sulfate proteoglycan 6)